MAKFITTKYGTKINVTGLSPEQIARVKSTAQDRGAYGTKGAALADAMRKRNQKREAAPAPGLVDRTNTTNPVTGETGETGQFVDPSLGRGGVPDPGTVGVGDTATTADNFLEGIFQNFQPLDLANAPKVLTDNDLAASRQSAYQSIYDLSTKNLQRNKERDLEAQKQELAERGIPYDPANPDSLYGKTVGSINERYDQLYSDAENQANLGADARLTAQVNANSAASNAFLQNAMAQYGAQLDAASTSGNIIQDLMTKYGIDQQTAIAKRDDATRRYIARMQSRRSGGGAATNQPVFAGDPSIV